MEVTLKLRLKCFIIATGVIPIWAMLPLNNLKFCGFSQKMLNKNVLFYLDQVSFFKAYLSPPLGRLSQLFLLGFFWAFWVEMAADPNVTQVNPEPV